MMKRFPVSAVLGVLLLVGVAACGSSSGSSGGGSGNSGMTLSITTPTNGVNLTLPFTLTVATNTELGPENTGKHHVHLYFDGKDSQYEVIRSTTSMVNADSPALAGLAPGEHTMNVSLRNADHSPAGAETSIKVMVAGGGAPAPATTTDSGDYGYGY